jgi:hypothetical protein
VTLQDQLNDLIGEANVVRDRVASAVQKDTTDLETEVNSARDSAQAQADKLNKKAKEDKGTVSAWWDRMAVSWDEHVAAIHKDKEERRADHDEKAAQRKAERADKDASYALETAHSAILEAGYAVLDAERAHRHADELRHPTSGVVSRPHPLRADPTRSDPI